MTAAHPPTVPDAASDDGLRQILDALPALVAYVDPQERYRYANRAYQAFVGKRGEELIGHPVAEVLGDTCYAASRHQVRGALAGRRVRYESTFRRPGEPSDRHLSVSYVPDAQDGAVRGFVALILDVTDRKAAEERGYRYAERLQLLREIDQALLAAWAPDDIARTAVGPIRSLVSAARVSVVRIDTALLEMTELAADGILSGGNRAPLAHAPLAPSLAQALREGVAVTENLAALEQPSRTQRALVAAGVTTVTKIPLIAEGQLLGTLNLGAGAEQAIRPDSLELIAEVAQQLAVALSHAAIRQQTEQRLHQLSSLHRVGIAVNASLDLDSTLNAVLDQLPELGIDAGTILLLDPVDSTLRYVAQQGFRTTALQHTQLRLGEGKAGRAALERRIVRNLTLTAHRGDLERSPLLAAEGFVAYLAVPLIAKGNLKGVLELLHRAPISPTEEWMSCLETFAAQIALAIDNAALFEEVHQSREILAAAHDETLEGWVRALDLRDNETEGHSRRVTQMAVRLARAMGVTGDALDHIRRGALLHDIGKIGVPDRVLHKVSPLTSEEWALLRRHPELAKDLLWPITHLRPALDIPYCHHERWDGSGYPRGLGGEEIPLAARIFAVVDVWDALRSERVYRRAWDTERVRAHLREFAGRQFDPQVVEVFLESGIADEPYGQL